MGGQELLQCVPGDPQAPPRRGLVQKTGKESACKLLQVQRRALDGFEGFPLTRPKNSSYSLPVQDPATMHSVVSNGPTSAVDCPHPVQFALP